MKINLLKESTWTENFSGISTMTRKMVWERAIELAVINGRSVPKVLKSNWEQAKRELSGEPGVDPKILARAATSQSELWIRCLAQPDARC